MKRISSLLLVFVLFFSFTLNSKRKELKNLPIKHKTWLQKDVKYIITPLEQEVFLKLQSDRERDLFILAFWKQRDPNPNTPENEAKKEHYRRIKYVNQWFGRETPAPGWRTERGRIYITLGEPNYISRFLNRTGMYPVIIWFYSGNVKYGLPNSFNVVFFQKGGMGEFLLYTPVKFGPSSLLSTYMGDKHNHLAAYEKLFSIEPEVAATSLTLIPSESQFTTTPQVSSEILVRSKIPAVPQKKVNDSYAEKILQYRGTVEVEKMINYIENNSLVRVIRQKSGIYALNYLIEPKRLSLERYENYLYTNLEVNGRITDMNNKLVYQYSKRIPVKLSLNQLQNIKNKLFSFQDILPLIKGNYRYNFLLMNNVSREFTSIEGDIIIPEGNIMQMSSIILANRAIENSKYKGKFKPFLIKNVQLVPSPRNDFNSKDTLYLYFQIHGLSAELQQKGIVEYKILNERSKKNVFTLKKNISDYDDNTNFFEKVSLKNFPVAYYTITVSIYRKMPEKILEEYADFYIAPMQLSRPWILYPSLPIDSTAIQYNILGIQYLNKKNYTQARSMLEKAHYKKPNSIKFALDYTRVLFKLREYKKVKEITSYFKDNPDKAKFYSVLGDSCKASGDYQGAISYYKKYLSHFGMNIHVLNTLGESHFKIGEKKEALNLWKKSIAENPKQKKIKALIAELEGGQNE